MDKQRETIYSSSNKDATDAEGNPQPSSLGFLQLPEEQHFDKTAMNLLKVVKKLIAESFDLIANEFDRKMKEENHAFQHRVDEKIGEITTQCNYMQKRMEPILPLLAIGEPGKSLIDSICGYVQEVSVKPMFMQIKEQILPHYATKDDMKKELVKQDQSTTKEVNNMKQFVNMEIENLRKKCLFSDTFERFRTETSIMMDDIRRKEQHHTQVQESLLQQVKSINELVGKKADSDRVWELSMKFDDYATREQLGNVERDMSFLASKEETEEVKQEIRGKYAYLKLIIDTHATKDETLKAIQELKDQVYSDVTAYFKAEDFISFKSSYELDQKALLCRFPEIDERFFETNSQVQLLKDGLTLKADDIELKAVAASIEQFAKRVELQELEGRVMPEIAAFRQDMFASRVERKQHTDILLRYDEILLDKASKFNIAELREDVYRTFARVTYMEDIDIKLKEHKETVKNMHKENMKKFDDINEHLTVEIYSAVKKAIKKFLHVFEKAKQEHENSSKGVGKEFMALVQSKASQQDFEELSRSKANKVDTEQLLDSIQIVHRQLKQALVLIIDSLRSGIDNPIESAQSKDNKQKFILNQLGFLARWVISYDPHALNHTNQGEKIDFLQDQEGRQLIDYTDQLMKEVSQISHKNLQNVPINFQNLRFLKSRGSHDRKQNQSQTYSLNPYPVVKKEEPNEPIHHKQSSITLMKSAMERQGLQNSGLAGVVMQASKHLSNRSPVNNNLSELSFISHQDQGLRHNLQFLTAQGELIGGSHQSYMTIDQQNLKVSLKQHGVKLASGRAPPKIDTAPTSPVATRQSMQKLEELLGSKTKRVIRESPKLGGGGGSLHNNLDLKVQLGEFGSSHNRNSFNSQSSKQMMMIDKRTIDLPPLI